MGSRQNKIWLLFVLQAFFAGPSYAQYDDTASVYFPDTAVNIEYDPDYHFHDTAQWHFENTGESRVFDSAHWKELSRDLLFEEELEKKDTQQNQLKGRPLKFNTNVSMPWMKFVLIGLAILAIAFVVYKFMPVYNRKNNVKDGLLIDLDEMDEEQIRIFELDTPLAEALRNGDYRKAYRLRYLDVLKQLVSRNLILFRKERTNYEYLLQLTGKNIYEPFRLLTFNFDGIWYGDLLIDKDRYEALDLYFSEFNHKIRE